MASGIYIYIKMKPYLVEFLQNKFGPNIKASLKNGLLPILVNKLRTTPKDYIHSKFDNTLCVELPYINKFNIRYRNYLSVKSQRDIEKHYEEIFLLEFYAFMYESVQLINSGKYIKKIIGNKNNGMDINKAVNKFMRIHNISVDHFECLKKKFYRSRKQIIKEQKKIEHNIYNSNKKLTRSNKKSTTFIDNNGYFVPNVCNII